MFHQHPATGRLLYHVFIGDSKPLTLQWPLLLGGGNLNPKNVSSKSPTRCIRSYFYEETFINLHYLLWTSVLAEPNICFHNMYTSRLHFHDLILLVSHLCSPLPFPKCSGFLSKRLFVDKNLSKWLGNKTFMTSTGSRRVLLGGRGGFYLLRFQEYLPFGKLSNGNRNRHFQQEITIFIQGPFSSQLR